MSTTRFVPIFALASLLASPVFAADTAARLTELAPGSDDGLPALDAAVVGGNLYFAGEPGPSLWRYDGVSTPTAVPGSSTVDPGELIAWSGRLYFQGGPDNDRELWAYDPVGGTIGEVADMRASGNGLPQRFAVFGNRLCFAAFSDSNGFEPWCWDGTNPPQMFDLAPGADSSYPTEFLDWNGELAFVISPDGDESIVLWDGTTPPAPVAANPAEPFDGPCCLAAVGDQLYFQAAEPGGTYRLWQWSGAGFPTRVSTTFEPWGYATPYRNLVYIDGEDSTIGVLAPELFRSVGGALRRVDPGGNVYGAEGHRDVDGRLYFYAYPSDTANDGVIFRYCGAGDVSLASPDFAAAGAVVTSTRPVAFDGKLFVSAEDPIHGNELWAVTPASIHCDGFENGTIAVW